MNKIISIIGCAVSVALICCSDKKQKYNGVVDDNQYQSVVNESVVYVWRAKTAPVGVVWLNGEPLERMVESSDGVIIKISSYPLIKGDNLFQYKLDDKSKTDVNWSRFTIQMNSSDLQNELEGVFENGTYEVKFHLNGHSVYSTSGFDEFDESVYSGLKTWTARYVESMKQKDADSLSSLFKEDISEALLTPWNLNQTVVCKYSISGVADLEVASGNKHILVYTKKNEGTLGLFESGSLKLRVVSALFVHEGGKFYFQGQDGKMFEIEMNPLPNQ